MVWMGAPRRGAASACCLLQPASVASCRKMLTRTAAAFLKERVPPCRGMPRCAVRPCSADFGIFLQGAAARVCAGKRLCRKGRRRPCRLWAACGGAGGMVCLKGAGGAQAPLALCFFVREASRRLGFV